MAAEAAAASVATAKSAVNLAPAFPGEPEI